MSLAEIIRNRKLVYLIAVIGLMLLAATIRLQPTTYGIYLYEYDPFFQYWLTKQLIDHGPGYWFQLTKDNIKIFWYPVGREIWRTEYPGVAYLGYISYLIVRPLVPSLTEDELIMAIGVFLPVIAGMLEVLAVFLIGKEIKDHRSGLFAAFLTAVLPSAIDRTIAGFYTKLGFGVMLFLYSMYFYIKSVKLGFTKKALAYASLAGLFLGLVGFTWGGYPYAALVYAVYSILIVFLGMNNRNYTVKYTLTLSIAMTIFLLTPKIGPKFMISLPGYGLLMSVLVLYFDLMLSTAGIPKNKRFLLMLSLASILGVLYLIPASQGVIGTLPGRILSIIFPWLREINVLFASVAEHASLSWDYIFYHLSAAFFFIPLGLIYLVLDASREKYLVFTAAIVAIYSFASAAYLAHLAGPLVALVGAYGVTKLFDTYIVELVKKPPKLKKKIKGFVKIDSIPIIAVIIIVLFIIALTAPVGIRAGNQAPTIVSPQITTRGKNTAWLQALTYIRNNLPPQAVVAAWWDYGYWITVIGNKTSICDNATINATQIRYMAWALMGNETYAAHILLDKLKTPPNETYVLAFEVFIHTVVQTAQGPQDALFIGRGGDVSKSVAIINVGHLNISEYYDVERGNINWYSNKTANALLFKMLIWGAYNVSQENGWLFLLNTPQGAVPVEYLPITGLEIFELKKAFYDITEIGGTEFVVIVVLYKLNYEKYLEAISK